MPLGRFLEVSIAASDVAASLAFYESLGFVQARVGEAWPHPYAVVTDGRLCIGLHQRDDLRSPTLTWVLPGLAQRLAGLAALGIEFEYARVDDVSFHEACFLDPSNQPVSLLEARTFSPPALAPTHSTALGYFAEYGLPATDLATASAFWDRLGFVVFEPEREPFLKIVVACRDLNLGLYGLDLRGPVLTFTDPAMPERVAALRDQGHDFTSRLPRGLDARSAALLRAPEGTELLLLSSGDG